MTTSIEVLTTDRFAEVYYDRLTIHSTTHTDGGAMIHRISHPLTSATVAIMSSDGMETFLITE